MAGDIDWKKWALTQLAELHERAKGEHEPSYLPVSCPSCGRLRLLPYDTRQSDDMANAGLELALTGTASEPQADDSIDEPVCEFCQWRPSYERFASGGE
jgi:hypothetical protein